MDLTNRTIIRDLLKRYEARADKKFGQHFILSKKALTQMIATAKIKKTDTVVEIGPGLGALTQELAATGAKIIAIEKDPLMVIMLKETLKDFKNVKIIEGDARYLRIVNHELRIKNPSHNSKFIIQNSFKIVANLPYNIATFLIHQWLEEKPPSSPMLRRTRRPEAMVLMIQKEVAQRICPPEHRAGAKPPHMNLLAVSVQFYAEAKIIDYVKKGSFWPQPKVDSAIIEIIPNPPATPARAWRAGKNALFFKVVKAGFSQPRKQLMGNLVKKLSLPKDKIQDILKMLGISEKARAENLSMEQLTSLASAIYPQH